MRSRKAYDTAWHEIATKHDIAELNTKINSLAEALKHDSQAGVENGQQD